MTLIELLGALTLVFILGIGAFSTLNQSFSLFRQETNRIDVRGQANIIVNQLTTFYQKNGEFTIIPHGDGIRVESGDESREYSIPNHQIEVEYTEHAPSNGFVKMEITIIISGGRVPFELTTVVSRLVT